MAPPYWANGTCYSRHKGTEVPPDKIGIKEKYRLDYLKIDIINRFKAYKLLKFILLNTF